MLDAASPAQSGYFSTSAQLLLTHWAFCLSAFTGSVMCVCVPHPNCCNSSNKNTPLPLSTVSHRLFVTLTFDPGFSIIISGGLQIPTMAFCHILICLSKLLSALGKLPHTTNQPAFTPIRYLPAAAWCLFGNSTRVHVCSERCVSR